MILDGMTSASSAPLTLQDVNEQNHRFWSVRNEIRDRRMSDESLLDIAMEDIRSEMLRGGPVGSQKSFDQALADAEMTMKTLQSGFARKGGSTPRSDALQNLIEEIRGENPKITQGQLLIALSGPRGEGTVTSIDKESEVKAGEPRMIHFVEENERPKRALLSGLKDRLYRAKKKIASR